MSYLDLIRQHGRFLAFGFALTFFSSFGQTFFISLFSEQIRDVFDLTHGEFGGWYSLATLASGLSIIWLGQKLDTIDLRLFTAMLCGGLALAALGMALVPSIAILVVAIYLLRFTGQGLFSHTAMTSMARYFDHARGKAMSIANLGHPSGEGLLPRIAVGLMAAIGWRQTWFVIACFVLIIVTPLVLWLLRGHRERHETYLRDLARAEEEHERDRQRRAAVGEHSTGALGQHQWTRLEVLRDWRFYVLLPAITASGFIATGVFFHQVHLVETKGWSLKWFATCFMVFAAMQWPANISAGAFIDRYTAHRLMPVILVPMALSLVVLGLFDHSLAAPGFMVLLGITSGLTGPVVGSMWAEVYGVRHLGAIRAMATSIMVFGTAAAPISSGWLLDVGISIETIALWGAAYVVLASVLAQVAVGRRI